MNRALSPYDLIVDMPTSTSEKLMKMGDRVTLYRDQLGTWWHMNNSHQIV
jgi:hypothetical protein